MEKNHSLSDFGVTRHEGVLKNSLKAILIRRPYAPIYAAIIMRAGSLYDPPELPGLAHFSEHILAAGSPSCFKEDFWGIMESVGGFKNATTSDSWMSVQCEVADPEDMPEMKKHFTHALCELYCPDYRIREEQKVIAAEMDKANSKLDRLERNYVNSILTNGTQWITDSIGTRESIQSITAPDVEHFFFEHCVAENMVLLVVGGCEWIDIEETFSDIPLLHGALQPIPDEPLPVSGEYWLEQDTPETRLRYLFPLPDTDTREFELLTFALQFAHDGFTSRFYRKLRNEQNLAYSLGNIGWRFWKKNWSGTYIGTPREQLSLAYEAMMECYRELVQEGISQKEIDRKNFTRWKSDRRSMQRNVDWVYRIMLSELYPVPNALYGMFPDQHNYRKTFTSEEMNEALRKHVLTQEPLIIYSGRK